MRISSESAIRDNGGAFKAFRDPPKSGNKAAMVVLLPFRRNLHGRRQEALSSATAICGPH
ncbi:hypothetical protein MPLSOD_140016 [Mesorhizobium sp. SOD10]|nr:hypothetical protein MPLSOD_140016 [Mesorhizobium sp. SOD10]